MTVTCSVSSYRE